MVLIGSDDGYLYAINPIADQRVWRVDAGANPFNTLALHGTIFTLAVKAVRFSVSITADKIAGTSVQSVR
jgi:outer membrane protein assembly factor BamB